MTPEAAASAVMRVLIDEARHAIAVLAYLARTQRNAFNTLMERADAESWTEVAQAAAASVGAAARWLSEQPRELEFGGWGLEEQSLGDSVDRRTAGDHILRLAARCVRTSAIARASLNRVARGRRSSADAQRFTALAALSI